MRRRCCEPASSTAVDLSPLSPDGLPGRSCTQSCTAPGLQRASGRGGRRTGARASTTVSAGDAVRMCCRRLPPPSSMQRCLARHGASTLALAGLPVRHLAGTPAPLRRPLPAACTSAARGFDAPAGGVFGWHRLRRLLDCGERGCPAGGVDILLQASSVCRQAVSGAGPDNLNVFHLRAESGCICTGTGLRAPELACTRISAQRWPGCHL